MEVSTGALYLALTGAIGVLFRLLIERCYRAEKQVDTTLPLIQQMILLIQGSTDKITGLTEQVGNLKGEIERLREALRQESGGANK